MTPAHCEYFGRGRLVFESLLAVVSSRLSVQEHSNDELTLLMNDWGSDKGSDHNYTELYAPLMCQDRLKIRNLFEVGIGTNNPDLPSSMGTDGKPGASLRAWRDYFPQAQISGGDVDRAIMFTDERIDTYFLDQLDPVSIKQVWSELGERKIDIFIDDGLHQPPANIHLFTNSFHIVEVNGLYIIEDILNDHKSHYTEFFSTREDVHGFMWTLPCREKPLDNTLLVMKKLD